MLTLTLLLIAVGFAVALPATWLALVTGRRLHALDGPGVSGQVKAPPRRVPNTGGIGIFLGSVAPAAAIVGLVRLSPDGTIDRMFPALATHLPGLRESAGSAAIVLACTLALHVLGLIDDRRPLGALRKLALMILLAATASIGTGTRLLTLLDAPAGGPWLSYLVTVLYLGVVTNAFNFLDNMDGLAAGVGTICAGAFLTIALLGTPPQWFIGAMLALLLGSLLGFLIFNFPFRARSDDPQGRPRGGALIFMGDGGSLVLGFLLAFLSVRITYVPAADAPAAVPWHQTLIPLIILAVPLYDFCSVTIIRLSQGRSPFVGDLQHFSHRLVRHGLTPRAAVLTIYGVTAVTCIGGLAMPRLEPWQGVLVGVQTLVVLAVLAGYEWARTP